MLIKGHLSKSLNFSTRIAKEIDFSEICNSSPNQHRLRNNCILRTEKGFIILYDKEELPNIKETESKILTRKDGILKGIPNLPPYQIVLD